MFRVTAGETVSRAVTVPGSGPLTTETFEATVRDQRGNRMTATAEITNAADREVTVTVAADQWRTGDGGYGRLELMMTANGTKSAVAEERFRVLPGQNVADCSSEW